MKQQDVPAIWQHLPFYRGYPVPYFVHWDETNGTKTPNFHLADPKKWKTCLKYNKCWVCGKPLGSTSFVVSGPQGLKNRIHTDTFMHEACARESLRVCPHLLHQKTVRREVDAEKVQLNPAQVMNKPDELALVKTGKYQIIFTGQSFVINFQPLAVQWFHYVDGILVARTEKLETVDSMNWKTQAGVVVSVETLDHYIR